MLTIIGDVHGKYKNYHEIIQKNDCYPYTVQLGDFGFNYEILKDVDPQCHKIVAGNHDNYDQIIHVPHYLGDYGVFELGGVEFFFYRGAYSIDHQTRTIGVDWWQNEQLSIDEFNKAMELYANIKPNIVITHDCPSSMVTTMLRPDQRVYQNMTGWALNELLYIHQPDIWIHGHYHVSKKTTYGKTKFICLNELETYKI